MTRLLLDTSVLISVERGRRAPGTPLATVIPEEADVAIAALTVAELTVGVELASARHRAERAEFVDDLRRTVPTIPYDERVADATAFAELPRVEALPTRPIPSDVRPSEERGGLLGEGRAHTPAERDVPEQR